MGSIRTLRPEDRMPIRELLIETDVFSAEEIDIAVELIDIVLEKSDQKDYLINIFEESDVVSGYYCVGPTPATESTFDLYWIAVSPLVQGKGVGKLLAANAEDLIRSRGGRLVVAETSSQPKYEKTRIFYKKNGYQELARIREYYKPGDDLIVFGKYLS